MYVHAVKRRALDNDLRSAESATDTTQKCVVWQHAKAASEVGISV